jgi:23S rRNA pseudouridine1911/1915/1917 synthase
MIAPNSIFSYIFDSNEEMRLDKFLSIQFPAHSRTFLQQLIHNNCVTINGAHQQKASWKLKENDKITVHFPEARNIQPASKKNPNIEMDIIHKDEHFMVLNKPANLAVHPTNKEDPQFTLVDWLLLNFPEIGNLGFTERPGIIHRLDKDTSGIIIIALSNHGQATFGKMFQNRTISKTYKAIVHGAPPASGTIEAAIGRNKYNKTKMAVPPDIAGPERDAITHYKVIEYFDNHALLELKPVTGRTHQIRIHLASIGHPILGDKVYGEASKLISRQALHAFSISFEFNNKKSELIAPLSEDIEKTVIELRSKKS